MSCDWNLDKTQIGIVLEFFQSDVIGIWITHNFEMSQNIFDKMRLELAETQFGIVLEHFQCDAIGIWLRHSLELS